MIKFFDYIFYRVSEYYNNKWKDAQGMIYGIGVVSIMQLTHILFTAIICALLSENVNDLLFRKREGLNFMHSGIIYPCLLILAINFFRYLKFHPFEKVKTQWNNEEINIKNRRGRLVIIYILLNLRLTISLSIYRKYYFD